MKISGTCKRLKKLRKSMFRLSSTTIECDDRRSFHLPRQKSAHYKGNPLRFLGSLAWSSSSSMILPYQSDVFLPFPLSAIFQPTTVFYFPTVQRHRGWVVFDRFTLNTYSWISSIIPNNSFFLLFLFYVSPLLELGFIAITCNNNFSCVIILCDLFSSQIVRTFKILDTCEMPTIR